MRPTLRQALLLPLLLIAVALPLAPPASATLPALTVTAVPKVTGSALVGTTLTASRGSWTPAPTGYRYRWVRVSGTRSAAITGATRSTYRLTGADAGKRVRVEVTAVRTGRRATTARSALTAVVKRPTTLTVVSSVPSAGTLHLAMTLKFPGARSFVPGGLHVDTGTGTVAAWDGSFLASQTLDTDLSLSPGVNWYVVRWIPSSSLQQARSVTVSVTVPVISTASLPAATVGTPYQAQLKATGATTPTWRVVSGVLPAGIALAVDGTLSGTPVATGTASFTVGLMSAGYPERTRALSIAVGPGGSDEWTSVDVGDTHTCGLRRGELWCWGSNFFGELANGKRGTGAYRLVPDRAGSASDWTAVATGFVRTCGIRAGGQLWCTTGQDSGLPPEGEVPDIGPVRVGGDSDWTTVTAGDGHQCGLRGSGQLWCWGANGRGQLGLGDNGSRTVPTRVGARTDWTSVSAGYDHTCGRTADGAIWCWGGNDQGQLGLGDKSDRAVPVRVGVGSWTSVVAGGGHTCGRVAGALRCWGLLMKDDDTGIGDLWVVTSPTTVGTATDWTLAVPGADHTCGLRGSGELWCWGAGTAGQTAGLRAGSTPRRVGADADWTAVSAGGVGPMPAQTCAIRVGQLWCWGSNNNGQLGVGDDVSHWTPTRVTG